MIEQQLDHANIPSPTFNRNFHPYAFGKKVSALFILATILLFCLATNNHAQAASNIDGDWKVNANNHLGTLNIKTDSNNIITGTIYDDTIKGYYASDDRTAVFVRYHKTTSIPKQVFIAKIQHRLPSFTIDLSGHFYGLDETLGGASQNGNRFEFTTNRTEIPKLSNLTQAASKAAQYVWFEYTIYNRPTEFLKANPGELKMASGAFGDYKNGAISGSIFNDPFIGYYSQGDGSLVMLRHLSNFQPLQIFIGQACTDLFVVECFKSGYYYALTPGMGATPKKMTYTWMAD